MTSWHKTILRTLVFLLVLIENPPIFAKQATVDLDLGLGYRVDRLDWNTGGVFLGLPALSELTWDDIRIQEIKGGGRFIVEEIEPGLALYVRGSAGYGQIVEGENQDSDFFGHDRTDEFSRSNNDADDGSVLDGSFGIGLQKNTKLKQRGWLFKFAPLVGYSYHEQNLKMLNGVQTVPSPATTFPGLNSSYKTEWKGPWVGIDFSLETDKQLSLFGIIEYHWPDYAAEANWNLRPDFAHPVSFTHTAEGQGLLLSAGWEYQFLPRWAVSVALEYLDWTTKRGTAIDFNADGTLGISCLNPDGSDQFNCLNEVNWESQSLTLGIVHRFN